MTSSHVAYDWLDRLFPERARPVGFYPLPASRADVPFDPAWLGDAAVAARTRLLYIHVPFCEQRCGYCRFYPGPATKGIEDQFIAGAIAQLQWWAQALGSDGSEAVQAVFIGGGSPSALSPVGLRTLLSTATDLLHIAPNCEITMEWYPADATQTKLDAALSMGVSRFSVGAQSWDAATLTALGCHHTDEEIDRLLTAFERNGIINFNIDLMCNAPGQELASHVDDIRRAADAGATMISTNILELAAGTPYVVRGGVEDADAMKRNWLRRISRLLPDLGYTAQRTRNFYRDTRLHQYNRLCTGLGFDIIPVGPSAYGYVAGMPIISDPDRARWRDHSKSGAIVGYSKASAAELRRAFVANSLLELMIDFRAYVQIFDADPFDDFPILAALAEHALLLRDDDVWRLAPAGVEYADDIIVSIFSAPQRELFARHLDVGRSRTASQYFPLATTSSAPKGADPL